MSARLSSRRSPTPEGSSRVVPRRSRVRAQGGAAGPSSGRVPSIERSKSTSQSLSARIARFLSAASPPASSDLPPRMYSRALALCREQDYERAFAVFERVVTLQPQNSKAWVSWAQAEKRATAATARDNNSNCCSSGSESNNNENCNGLLPSSPSSVVAVLQAGLSLNRGAPPSARAPLAQAWALHELQRGNSKAAMALLARAVREDPERCSPVLRWAPVVEAAREAAEEEERRRKGEGKKSGSGSGVAAAGPSA